MENVDFCTKEGWAETLATKGGRLFLYRNENKLKKSAINRVGFQNTISLLVSRQENAGIFSLSPMQGALGLSINYIGFLTSRPKRFVVQKSDRLLVMSLLSTWKASSAAVFRFAEQN